MTERTGQSGIDVNAAFISRRSVALDCIRATAIIMVVMFHVATRYPIVQLDPVARLFRNTGTLGVDVFFPLSGYLITTFLIRHVERGAIRTFFLRRIFRIIPLYFAAVTIYCVAVWALHVEPAIFDRIWIPYTFLTGWFIFFDGVITVPYTITWSLSVEEFSYVLIGLAALIWHRRLLWLLVVLSLFSLGLRYYLNLEGHADIYYFPLARIDSIALGGLMAWFLDRGRPVIGWLVFGIAASIGLRLLGGAFGPTFLYTLVTFLTCLAIAISVKWLAHYHGRLAAAYARIGFYSYFIYLFHFMLLEALLLVQQQMGIANLPFWINALLCLGLSYLAAMASFRYFEGPLMLFGRSFETKRLKRSSSRDVKST